MAVLNQVTNLQQQGKSDNEIMAHLQNKGIPPHKINQSLQQAEIKNAVINPNEMQSSIMDQDQNSPTQAQQPLQSPNQPQQQPQQPQQQPNQPQQQFQQPQQTQQYPEYDPNKYYPQTNQVYSNEDCYPQESYSTETISEIATQIGTELLDDYKHKVGDVAMFKNKTNNKIENIDNRLKKIENSIDKLQQAIIGKIGEFGDTTAMIHHDLDNLHGTVAKLMNPLIDNIRALETHGKKTTKKK